MDAFPSYQFQDVNNPTTVKFNLTAAPVAAHNVRIGITDAFSSGRPKITVNGWTASRPRPTSKNHPPPPKITPHPQKNIPRKS